MIKKNKKNIATKTRYSMEHMVRHIFSVTSVTSVAKKIKKEVNHDGK